MDRHLRSGGHTVYRVAQCLTLLIIVIRALLGETPSHQTLWFSSSLIAIAVYILASIVRMLGGNVAGAIGSVVICLHPEFSAFSPADALSFCGLSALMFLLATRNLTGSAVNLPWFRSLSIVMLFVALIVLFVGRSHVLLGFFGVAPDHFKPLLALESGVTLWWLYASIQSKNRVSVSLTAVPVVYLLFGSLVFTSVTSYACPAHPILLANVIALLALWWRGRTNKRVLDSTTN